MSPTHDHQPPAEAPSPTSPAPSTSDTATPGTPAAGVSASEQPLQSPQARSDWPLPVLHPDSASLRFWVAIQDAPAVGAVISLAALHHRYQAGLDGANALATYQAHRAEIDDAVRRRVARGSIEPVMLREADLPAPPKR